MSCQHPWRKGLWWNAQQREKSFGWQPTERHASPKGWIEWWQRCTTYTRCHEMKSKTPNFKVCHSRIETSAYCCHKCIDFWLGDTYTQFKMLRGKITVVDWNTILFTKPIYDWIFFSDASSCCFAEFIQNEQSIRYEMIPRRIQYCSATHLCKTHHAQIR